MHLRRLSMLQNLLYFVFRMSRKAFLFRLKRLSRVSSFPRIPSGVSDEVSPDFLAVKNVKLLKIT